ncbi:O-antigen ligase family protein [Romboutsia ilealis]|uniref:O-antigen ligase family protein n=1 Tax=Romboutsia ilealis TaxID=1115758 RepID=UPI002730E1C9|nr:O-antigen ligase family protein [Romboutsia ilealis]
MFNSRIDKRKWFFINFILLYILIQLFISSLNITVIQFIFGCKVILFYIPLYFIFYFIDDVDIEKNIYKVTKILSISIIIMSLIGIIQKKIGYYNLLSIYGDSIRAFTTKGILRVFSSTASPFEYSWACLIVLAITFSYILFENRNKVLINLGFISSIVGIILSNSREGILNLLVILFTIFLMKCIIKNKKIIKIYILIIPILGILLFNFASIIANMDIVTENVYLNTILSGESFKERLIVFENAINFYESKGIMTILFGNGIGSLGAAQSMMNKLGYNILANPVDNMYLYLYLNIGLVGILGIFIFIYLNVNMIVESIDKVKQPYFQVSTLAIIASILVSGYFRTVIEGFIVQILMIYILGLSYKYAINSKKNYS